MRKGWIKTVILIFFIIYIFYICYHIDLHKEEYQWDFKTYYYASRAYSMGLNPYGLENLSKIAKERIRYRFIYPPITLWFFRIFSLFNYEQSFIIFLIFKFCLLISLIFLWKREFLQTDNSLFFYVFCLMAFNSTIYRDILAGNISIIEQFSLWFGLYFLLKERLHFFCFLIIFASIFKITLIIFLLLILISKRKEKMYYLVGASITFCVIILVSYISEPSLFKSFIYFVTQKFRSRGVINPSTFSLLKDLFFLHSKKISFNFPSIIFVLTYLIIISLIIGLSFKSYYFLKKSINENKNKIIIFLFCLVYALILPRFKDYSYIILLVPTYYLIENFNLKRDNFFLFILCLISLPEHIHLPGFKVVFIYLWAYYPLVISYIIWILYLTGVSQLERSSPEKGGKYKV